MPAEQPEQADQDQIQGNDVVENARYEQDHDTGDQCDERRGGLVNGQDHLGVSVATRHSRRMQGQQRNVNSGLAESERLDTTQSRLDALRVRISCVAIRRSARA